MYPTLSSYIETIVPAMDGIPEERKAKLRELAEFIQEKQQADEPVHLNFICTHNSRRSHLSQLWAATAAAYYGIPDIYTYSGGTEATAFNARAVAAVERAGFAVENPGGDNPHYLVRFAPDAPALECFSKKYDDPYNPKSDFAAVMTCSEADKNCPVVFGASHRASIPYQDPKEADGTPEETSRYDERCRQIATEMFYLMASVR